MPWGLELSHDLARVVPEVRIATVFDVGANVGQSALDFCRAFQGATIWSFEPFEEPFRELVRATAGEPVHCFKLAFGAEPGTASVAPDRQSTDSTLLGADRSATQEQLEVVHVTTLDRFTEEHAINHIDLLKVDTEGFDLEVLRGAERCLRAQAILFVQVEAGMNPENRKHIPFELLKSYLEERGYVLFAVYEQVPEWTGEARLRFANPLFVAADVAKRTVVA